LSSKNEGAGSVEPQSIFISAGEASGEHYGARLVAELKQRIAAQGGEPVSFWGMGGDRMAEAGLETVVRSEEMAVMGFTEIVRHLPHIWRQFQKLKAEIRQRRPKVAVLIDFPEIHFRLAKVFHSLGIPVVFFVSPQLWAWKQHRIKLVERYVDRMLVIFPFEESFYRSRGIAAEFVGHPLAEIPLPAACREEFARANGLDLAKEWLGILPGSRAREIRDHLPEMLAAARTLHQEKPRELLLPLAPTLTEAQRAEVRALVAESGQGLPVHLLTDARAALHHARASVVASGTATVEAALIGQPFVVIYHVSAITFAIAKRMVKVDHVAMCNLIAGKRAVPELIQDDFQGARIVQELRPLLAEGEPRAKMLAELARVRHLLERPELGESANFHQIAEKNSIGRVAEVTLEVVAQAAKK